MLFRANGYEGTEKTIVIYKITVYKITAVDSHDIEILFQIL